MDHQRVKRSPKIIDGLKHHAYNCLKHFFLGGGAVDTLFLRIGVIKSQLGLFCGFFFFFLPVLHRCLSGGPMADGLGGLIRGLTYEPWKGP